MPLNQLWSDPPSSRPIRPSRPLARPEATREIAKESEVPLLEAPPLARALYKHCELEQAIPAALYTAVAEVMAYVYQLDAWMKQGGLPPVAPATLPVPAGMDPGAPEE